MGSGKVKKWRTEAHERASMRFCSAAAPNQVASGDDDGCVKLWDPRQPKETAELRQHTDYMSDFAHQVRPLDHEADTALQSHIIDDRQALCLLMPSRPPSCTMCTSSG